jgi:GNAT superfamily N-acetyltransferase
MELDIQPVTPDRWADLADLFERRGPRGGRPEPGWCWCMWWRDRSRDRDRNKPAMRSLVSAGREPGLLAYDSGTPVGWVSVAPREEFGQLERSPTYRPADDDEGVFAIVCFYVHPDAKRRGVANALIRAAVDYALRRGASAVEAYGSREPTDYMGWRDAFASAGFRAVRTAGKRTVMRYTAG